MATVKINEVDYNLPVFGFKKLKAAWPYITIIGGSTNRFEIVDAGLHVIAIGLEGSETPMTYDELNDVCGPAGDLDNVSAVIPLILKEAGMVADPGEVKAMVEGLLTGISTPSSQSSLPADAEIGTE